MYRLVTPKQDFSRAVDICIFRCRLGQCPREYIHDFVLIRQIPLGLIYGQQGINSLKLLPFHALFVFFNFFFTLCQLHFFSLLSWAAKTAQTEKFMFQILVYRPTVYGTGMLSKVFPNLYLLYQDQDQNFFFHCEFWLQRTVQSRFSDTFGLHKNCH